MNDVHALSGAYAIDALDDGERERFEEHLAGCADCRDEVASLQEAGAMLGASSAAVPPAALRARVLSDIATVRPLPPVVSALGARRDAVRRRRLPLLAAAAAAVVAVGVGAVVWQPWSGPDSGLRAGPPDASPSATLDAVEQVLAAPDAETRAGTLEGGGSATIVRSRELGRAVVVPVGLPELDQGHVYELWLRLDGRMHPAGLVHAGDDEVLLEGDATHAEAVGITVEPTGGSPTPTTQPIAYFPFEQA